MTKICEWCKREFEARYSKGKQTKFCSHECACMAKRKLNQEKREARAKELGITVDELIRRSKRGRVGLRDSQPKRYGHRPKSYREIVAANRKHPVAVGWRGAPVMGGW